MKFDYKSVIRSIPDYPKPGIIFRDITTLLGNARAFRRAVDELVKPYRGVRIDRVAGIEARGFILGGAVAHQLSVGFVPVRKKGKLPWQVLSEDYTLEYGTDRVEIHTDAVQRGDHIVVVDDLIATGGTCFAAIRLLERAGAKVIGCSFVIDLPDLGGADKLRALGKEVKTLVTFPGH
jgi:adenine phosphoribosyltransferase